MGLRPDDFNVRYEWREGSVPPPYYYEITISVSPDGEGSIVFCPGSPRDGAPVWEEHFRVSESQFDTLYSLMRERRVFDGDWKTYSQELAPEGGSVEWLEVVADGKQHKVPWLLLKPEAVEPLYTFIRSLVPDTIWAKFRARQEDFQAAYRRVR